jgi:two-component system response regulator QseB
MSIHFVVANGRDRHWKRRGVMRVLLVGGEPTVAVGALRAAGYSVDWARDKCEGEIALKSHIYDLILLDLEFPDRDGLRLLTEYRDGDGTVPVIIMTEREALAERISGLGAGADDYLIKPIDFDELGPHVRALARRRSSAPVYRHGDLRLDCAAHTAFKGDTPLPLVPREFALLQTLIQEPRRVFARTELVDKLSGKGAKVTSNAIDVLVHRLRQKIGGERILTLRGRGYRLAGVG